MGNDTANFYLAGAALAVFLATLCIGSYITPSRLPSPPGPPGLPVIRNLKDIPVVDGHLVYSRLARKYGPIMQFHSLGSTIIVISDVKIALDLLEKRGAIYSGRPKVHTAWESGFTWHLGFMPHNDAWRVRRRLVHQKFHAKPTIEMHGLLRRTALEFARDLLQTPDDFREHIKHAATSSIIRAVYGIRIAPKDDPYADIAERAMEAATVALPGNSLMDAVPQLRHVPPWVPILGRWTARARAVRQYPTAMLEVPYARAKDDMRAGTAKPCMAHEMLERLQTDPHITEQAVKDACAVSYLGGADTSVGTLVSFFMAMVLWPEYQRKAQAELDRVLGDRLPDFADRPSLPYVEAIVRETYRRYPVGPLGIPHAVDEDDVYDGYFIRSGSTVMLNVWDMMHDEAMYPDPETFNPDRWLKNGRIDNAVQDPRVVVFGVGRRICPGRHFADASVFLIVSTVLKCFDLGTSVNNGLAEPPSGEIHTGIMSCPVPFKCTIRPRSTKASELIDTALEASVD